MASNPRYQNGNMRRKHRKLFKSLELPCAICGRPIHYDEPSDAQHPYSFVIDEIIPVSRWKEFGYSSPADAAKDFKNLQPTHYFCNAKKSNKIGFYLKSHAERGANINDGEW